jgi:hypothetical protein
MSRGKLVKVKLKNGYWDGSEIFTADDQLASEMPDLKLPRMNDEARAAFRSLLAYEAPTGNGSLADFLALTEARGFSTHPSDWVPAFDNDPQHPALYQPWVDWLSEAGVTPFHEGNTLTRDNWGRWKPKNRARTFGTLSREDPRTALDLLVTVEPTPPAAVRLALLGEVNAGGMFYGNYPGQVPILKHCLTDRSDKVRALARERLDAMNGLETEAAHAAQLAKYMKMEDGRISSASEMDSTTRHVSYFCTTFEALAREFGLSPEDLARRSDLENLDSDFWWLAARTGSVAVRSIIASRMLDMKLFCARRLFTGVERELWNRGLQAALASEHSLDLRDFLGTETGIVTASQMRDLCFYKYLKQSILDEIDDGRLPVNTTYDPVRALALVVDKAAASELLDEVLSTGMKADNPRLTMLRYNLAL